MEAWGCPVTDDGIKGLCVSVDDFGKENAGLGQCKSLHTLDIFGTKVTTKGVEMALENLPDLKDFDCEYQIQVLAEMLRGPSRKNLRCLPNLTFLRNNGSKRVQLCKRGDIELVAATCSSVNKVHIDVWFIEKEEIADATILEFKKLKRLCELRFEGRRYGLTFNGGILPLLKHFSNSLTSLSFKLFDTLVNVRAIIEHCTELQTLNISWCNISPHERLEDEPNPSKRWKANLVLENLKTLKLDNCLNLTTEDLDLLLASPALEELSLRFIDLTIDDSLRKAANLHQFRNLQFLKLRGIRVTKVGIDLFMNENNPLKLVNLVVLGLKEECVKECLRVIREKNWDVRFCY